MKKVIEFILEHIVSYPEDLLVTEEKLSDDKFVYKISANSEDIPKIIGKHGRIIKSVRDIVKLVATKQNLFADVTVEDKS